MWCSSILARNNLFKIHEAICGGRTLLLHAQHFNLFDQLLVECINSIKAIYLVVDILLTVCGTIKQREQRLELLQLLTSGIVTVSTQYALRFVDNQDRISSSYYLKRYTITKFFQLSGKPFSILTTGIEGLCVDNHNVYVRVGGKTLNRRKVLAIIHKTFHRFIVLLSKVLFHYFKTFHHTFTNGNAWHNNDELCPTIEFVEFIHCLDIGVSLTRTSLHFNREVQSLAHNIGYRFKVLTHLNLTDVLYQRVFVKHDRLVTESCDVIIK